MEGKENWRLLDQLDRDSKTSPENNTSYLCMSYNPALLHRLYKDCYFLNIFCLKIIINSIFDFLIFKIFLLGPLYKTGQIIQENQAATKTIGNSRRYRFKT